MGKWVKFREYAVGVIETIVLVIGHQIIRLHTASAWYDRHPEIYSMGAKGCGDQVDFSGDSLSAV